MDLKDIFTALLPIATLFLGAGFLGFIQFLITRKDNKKKADEERKDSYNQKLDQIIRQNEAMELALCRLQLLNLIQHDGSQHETMMVAERYFKELDGDWYMTPIFCKWLTAHGLEKPVWFNGHE